MLHDLRREKRESLDRCRASIVELEIVLREMHANSSGRYLVQAAVSRLRQQEAFLAASLGERSKAS